MKLATILTTVLFSSSLFAADIMNFKLLGFSADNKYVAFAESVDMDGSGAGFASVSVVDVKGNNLVKRSNHTDQGADGDGSEAVALAQAISKANLSSYGIIQTKKGTLLLERLATDLSTYRRTVFSQPPTLTSYALTLRQSAARSNACENGESAKKLRLNLDSTRPQGHQVHLTMQNDTTLPASRGCVTGYAVSKVIKSGDALVVVVSQTSTGFEGADIGHMLITAEVALD